MGSRGGRFQDGATLNTSTHLHARRYRLPDEENDVEFCYGKGWTDGLPVVVPTEARVDAMLAGTARRSDEIIAYLPPDGIACTIEKAAINAVLAGCRPEY